MKESITQRPASPQLDWRLNGYPSIPKILLLLCLLATSVAAAAHDFAYSGIYYTITSTSNSNKTVGVTYRGSSYSEYSNEYSGSVTIPNTVTYNSTTYKVTSIQKDAFRDCTGLTFISIPENVTEVYLAFLGCTSLSTVYLTDSSSENVTRFYSNDWNHYYNDEDDEYHYNITDIPIFRDCPLQNLYIGHRFESCRYYEGIHVYDDSYGYYLGACSGSPMRSDQTINRVEYGSNVSQGTPDFGQKGAIVNLYIPSIEKWCNMYQCEKQLVDTEDYSYRYTGPTSNLMGSCQNLYVNNIKTTDIEIPTSVTSLGYAAFKDATCITSVTLPAYLSSIGAECFKDCANLKKVINNSSLTITKGSTGNGYVACYANTVVSSGDIMAGDYQFKLSDGKYYLVGYLGEDTDLVLPENVNGNSYEIAEKAFYRLSSISSVTIPSSVTSIGNMAFYDCSGLISVSIPASVTSIGNYAFNGCSALTSVYVNDISAWCAINFADNTSNPLFKAHNLYLNDELLNDMVVPNDVTSISNYAFCGCSSLNSLTIPASVTSIGNYAFNSCSAMTSVSIPASVTSIGYYAFRDCSGLTSVYVNDISAWCSINFIDSTSNPLCYAHNLYLNGELLTDLVIPNSVTSIGKFAFSGCSGLTSVVIPNSVTSIDRDAFSGCSGLTSVTIPNSVTSIGQDAFSGCSGLTSVTIPNSVTSIGYTAFSDCSGLTSLTIPESVTSISNKAFQNCSGLTTVNYNATKCSSMGDYSNPVFTGCSNITTLNIGTNVTIIPRYAFKGCSGLTSMTIPESVTEIAYSAFSDCSGLTSVTIPNSVTSIGNYAFSGCSGLTEIIYNATACKTFDGSSVFHNIPNLRKITIGENVTSIPDYAFWGLSSLKSLNIPESVTSIGDNALTGLNLQELLLNNQQSFTSSQLSGTTVSLTIGENLTEVPALSITGYETLKFNAKRCTATNGNFANSSSLKNVYVGDQVQMLPDNIFDGSDLETVVLGNSVKLIGTNAFNNCSGIKTINARGLTPANCLSHFPVQVYMDAELVVPGEALNTYKTAPIWSTFFNITTHDEIVEPDVMSMERPSITMDINDKTQVVVYLGSTIIPGNSLTWTSSNEAVATVNVNGQVTAVAPGHATITATNSSDESVSCEINVKESQFANLDDYLMISNIETSRYATFNIPVYMENKAEITAFQCDIYLPEGVKIKKNSKDRYAFTFGGRTDTMCHIISSADMTDGCVRIVVYSINNYPFSGNEGLLFNIPVEMGGETGTFEYSLRNITFSTTSNEGIYPIDVTSNIVIRTATEGDANGDEVVNVIDATTTVSYILGGSPESFVFDAADMDHNGVINVNDVTKIVSCILNPAGPMSAPMRHIARVEAGETPTNTFSMDAVTKVAVGESTMVPVMMNNDSPIIAYQCDITLPECMSLAMNDGGHYAFTQGDRADDHVLSSAKLDGYPNTYRILSYSPTNALFEGNSGVLFNIPVIVETGTAYGEYVIEITNIVLSEKGNKQIDVADIQATLIPEVKQTDEITWNLDLSDYEYEEAYQLIATSQSGLTVSFSLEIVEGNTTVGEESAEIYVNRGKTYLKVYEDCEIIVKAYTEGDAEYSPTQVSHELKFEGGKCVQDITAGCVIVYAEKETEDIYYDLMGRRVVNPAPGIYIRNGRKVLVK